MSLKPKFDSEKFTVYQGRVVARDAARRGDYSGGEPASEFSFGDAGASSPAAIAECARAYQLSRGINGVHVSIAEAVRHVMGVRAG